MEGDLFRGPHLVSGGDRAEARGILETKREIKDAARSHRADRDVAGPPRRRTPRRSRRVIAHASSAIAALNAEHHRQEKAVVGHEAQLQHAT